MERPVIITYFGGCPGYLIYALKSAAKMNRTVVLIGDETNKEVWQNHWDTNQVRSEKWNNFLDNFIQLSDYTIKYEIGFWKRLFFLEEWMKLNSVNTVFMVESDVLSFANYTDALLPLLPKECRAALVTPQKQDISVWASSTHVSYWTLQGLENFTNFSIHAYSNENIKKKLRTKYQWHIDHQVSGGITEMTLLYLWSKDNPRIFNLCRVINDSTVDLAASSPDNFYPNEYNPEPSNTCARIYFKKTV